MSTMTTIQRGTPALSVAPTQNQNTAPVYEFECLFTHDLRKKKKTWHDGSLRFHTFNRRVMVYDDSKNFIGDLHYRDADELQEGEELRLDKGVLVDVGRRIGQTDTDLSEVLDRGRHGEEGAAARHATPAATYQSTHKLGSAITQGRPKSLAAVLGVSQGPIGRAKLAIKSPYEQLHTARADQDLEGPPAKRQRVTADKENVPTFSTVARTAQQAVNRGQPLGNPSLLKDPLTVRRDTNTSKAVIDISSEDDNANSPIFSSAFGSSRSRQKGTKAVRNPPAKLDLAPKPSKLKQDLPSKPARPIQILKSPAQVLEKRSPSANAAPRVDVAAEATKAQAKHKASATTKPPDANARKSATIQSKQRLSIRQGLSARSARLSSGPTTSLRFAPHKPRPKLMYRDLLPASFITSRSGSSKPEDDASRPNSLHSQLEQGRTTSPVSEPRRKACPDRDVFDMSSLESLPSQQQQQAPSSAESSIGPAAISPIHRASSPLFVSQSSNTVTAAATNIHDDSPVPSPIKTPVLITRSESPMQARDPTPEDSRDSVENLKEPPQMPPSVSKLTLMDQRLMMPPPPAAQAIFSPPNLPPKSPHPRPFRRVLSENDSPAQNINKSITSPHAASIPSALDSMQQRSRPQVSEPRRPFKSPTKLQRAHSDTSAMLQVEMQRPIGRININIPGMAQEEHDGDNGPWSSREAFLLFDWWPPNQQKPEYACATDSFVPPQVIRQDTNVVVTGFRSAGVIQDGVDI